LTRKGQDRNSFIGLIAALSTSTGIQIAIQIVSIPIFIQHFDVTKYSIWLVATNLAQVSTLLDLGSLSSIQNRFTYLGKLNDELKVRKIIGQFWNLIALTHLAALITGIILMKTSDLPITLSLVFLFSSFIQLSFGLYEALTRMKGNMAKGLAFSNILRTAEFFGYLIALFFPVSITQVALNGFIFKSLTACILYFNIVPKDRFIEIRKIDLKILGECIREGFPFLITRISDFIMISGVLIILQNYLTAMEIVAFSSARTFFRLSLQITNLYNHAYGYQMSHSWAEGDFEEMKRLIRRSFHVNLLLSIIGAASYTLFGNIVFQYWTHNSIDLNHNFFLVGALYSFVLNVNQGQKVKFNSINLNLRVSYILLLLSSMQISFTLILGQNVSLFIYFISLILNEILCFVTVAAFNRNLIQERFLNT
jgi:O-antigen/teichoic acid export membrane protein